MSSAAYFAEVNMICIMVIMILWFSTRSVSNGLRESLYRRMLVTTIAFCLADAISGVCDGRDGSGFTILLWLANIAYFETTLVFSICWIMYSLFVLTNQIHKRIVGGLIVLYGLFTLLVLSAPRNGWIFWIDDQNVYHRGPLVWLHWVVVVPCMLIPSLVAPFAKAEKRERHAINMYAFLPMFTFLAQVLIKGTCYIQVGLMCGLLMLYIMLQSRAVNDALIKTQMLEKLSYTDTLTLLQNRRAYDLRLDMMISESCVYVLFGDLNGLKIVNDTQGHKAGDRLICSFADILVEYFPRESVFRISGDEFVVISTDRDQFHIQLQKARLAIGNLASIGCSEGRGEEIMNLVSQAETRMYEAKKRYHELKP